MTINIIAKGGIIMIPIILGSIIALGFSIERIIYFRKLKFNSKVFTKEIFNKIKDNKIEEAISLCDDAESPLAAVYKKGLENIDESPQEIERQIETEGNRQVSFYEKNLSSLLIIAAVEPMMGFLGTIIGLIKAFMNWEQLGASVTVEQLASGIYQAMITTASGLIVAIPFYIVYHIFVAITNKLVFDLNFYGENFISFTNKHKKSIKENHEN
jgi:biopolymer transport protein ExbB